MKNCTLAFAIGTAVAITAIGLESNSASAVTITEVKATHLEASGPFYVEPGKMYTDITVTGFGQFSFINFSGGAFDIKQSLDIPNNKTVYGTTTYFDVTYPPTPEKTVYESFSGIFHVPIGQYRAKYTITIPIANMSDSLFLNFKVTEEPEFQVPEPLTILGTGVVLGAIPLLKKEYAKKKKKKDENA